MRRFLSARVTARSFWLACTMISEVWRCFDLVEISRRQNTREEFALVLSHRCSAMCFLLDYNGFTFMAGGEWATSSRGKRCNLVRCRLFLPTAKSLILPLVRTPHRFAGVTMAHFFSSANANTNGSPRIYTFAV